MKKHQSVSTFKKKISFNQRRLTFKKQTLLFKCWRKMNNSLVYIYIHTCIKSLDIGMPIYVNIITLSM